MPSVIESSKQRIQASQRKRNNNSSSTSANTSINTNNFKKNKKSAEEPKAPNRGYRSIHTNYKPFLKYIKNHEGIDEATVKRAYQRYGNGEELDYTNYSKKRTNTNMDVAIGFQNQQNRAKTKAERDAERHADLHANYKPSSYTDEDKIFLLKREIDNLKEQLNAGRKTKTTPSGATSSTAATSKSGMASLPIPLFTVMLVVSVLLLAARRFSRRLALIRSDDALLSSAELDANEPIGIVGVELQEQPSRGSGRSIFERLADAKAAAIGPSTPKSPSSASLAFV